MPTAPDYSPSAVHGDRFVPVRIGSDAALALSMCRVIVDEGLMDEDFVREQTDLGLLVRTDNGRFLRQRDLREDGSDSVFYLFEARSGRVRTASPLAVSFSQQYCDACSVSFSGGGGFTTVSSKASAR